MSRFDRLEFEDPKKARRDGASGLGMGTPIRDAAYFQQEAQEQFRRGDWEAALRNYSKALECEHTVFECWLMQVRCLTELGEYKEAGIWADKALEMFPEHPELFAAKAIAAVRMGQLDKAMAYSDNAMSRFGATPFVWLSRGEVLLARRGRMAASCLDKALAACVGTEMRAWMQLELARLLRRHGCYSQALHHASGAVAALPQHPAVVLELAECQAALGLPEAIVSFEEVLQLEPGSEGARRGLTQVTYPGFWGSLRRFFRRLFRR